MDLSTTLKELASKASRYSINLDGQIDLDREMHPLRGGTAWVYRGTLRRDGAKVAVKSIHFGPSGDKESLKVILGSQATVWLTLFHAAYSPGGAPMVQTKS